MEMLAVRHVYCITVQECIQDILTPNVPFQINASQGTQLNFYFLFL